MPTKLTLFSGEARRREKEAADSAASSGAGTNPPKPPPRTAPIPFILGNPTASGPQPKREADFTSAPEPAAAPPPAPKRHYVGPGKSAPSTTKAPDPAPILSHPITPTPASVPASVHASAPVSDPTPGPSALASASPLPPTPPAQLLASTVPTPSVLKPKITTDQPTLPPIPANISGSLPVYSPVVAVGLPSYAAGEQLRTIAIDKPEGFLTLVGLYFQDSGRSPLDVAGQLASKLNDGWVRDHRKLDERDKNAQLRAEGWVDPSGDIVFQRTMAEIAATKLVPFEATIRWWAENAVAPKVAEVLQRAGWTQESPMLSESWQVMDRLFKMNEGPEKEKLLAQAKQESPRFYQYCLESLFCGLQHKRKRADAGNFDEESITISYGIHGRIEQTHVSQPKVRKTMSIGRPTQFHGVPLEERAIDSKGNRLPWALEWPDDHPNAHGQKRHLEEKGPFGKSTRRRGTSRTRTATPAKKENPTLDGFEQALKHDQKKAAEDQQEANATTRAQIDANGGSQNTPSYNKEPTQVMLYGYSSSTQWAAIDLFEKMSGGMICEDYDRQPPAELRKYPNTFFSSVHSRPLTRQEKSLAFKYAGGEHWVKVTFDSAEAADRAINQSPHDIYGHLVYAAPFHGLGPETDQPILAGEKDLGNGLTARAQTSRKPSQTLGAAFSQHAATQQRAIATLPRSMTLNNMPQANQDRPNDAVSTSSSTASSATATGPEYPDLRHRLPSQTEEKRSSNIPQRPAQSQQDNQMMEKFPDRPRTVLRPASEAFLPQPTWWERKLAWFRQHGLIPQNPIGNELPLLENGQFDWARASYYWRFFYWIDTKLGSDFCGLKDD